MTQPISTSALRIAISGVDFVLWCNVWRLAKDGRCKNVGTYTRESVRNGRFDEISRLAMFGVGGGCCVRFCVLLVEGYGMVCLFMVFGLRLSDVFVSCRMKKECQRSVSCWVGVWVTMCSLSAVGFIERSWVGCDVEFNWTYKDYDKLVDSLVKGCWSLGNV